MEKNFSLKSFIITALLIILFLGIVIPGGYYLYRYMSYTRVIAEFDDAEPLPPKMSVFYKGFNIGKVTKVQPHDDYTKTENPITQILNYVGSLRTNKMKDKNGYLILTNENTQFYLYAVCNLTPKLRELAFDMDMMDTPDKKGMYKYHKNRNAHINILSYDKMLNDAENRNNHKY